MDEFKKYFFNTVFSIVTIVAGVCINTLWSKVDTNTSFSISHSQNVKELKQRMDIVEKNYSKMPDVYFTRREMNIFLDNINNKLNQMQNDTNSINQKLEKITDKLYQK